MENQSIKAKILADYQTLLALKFDSPELIKDKLKLISEHVDQLSSSTPEDNLTYENAANLLKSASTTEYTAFRDAMSDDEKEQALVQLKHKVAEACQLVTIHG
ncbi:hypothetical protein GO755_00650 [Spirosoma sp. HMF4905]|uniref:Uncharacterized protein n=1 Tax=Spirosoma arboris TaxID=2682092 RepID=A0A7K1S3Y6_9BACT|nr:hypothetical protein [Spirosoma arboris]MVM28520.1 hypothetical protein [Spirosoma arboris]